MFSGKTRYKPVLAVIILIFIGLACSCAPRETSPEVVVIRAFVGLSTGTDNHQNQIHRQLAREFNASHETIKLEFITVPHAEAVDRYLALRAAGQVPDLVVPLGVGDASATNNHQSIESRKIAEPILG